jgi:small subunit ribosomal protein S15
MQLIFLLNMARIHAHTRGQSHSTRPTSKNAPSWETESQAQLSALVLQLSKEGLMPSEIGIKMRDEYGIPLIKPILGKKVTALLAENDIKKDMPEDLDHLVRKSLALQKHLRTHNSDHRNVRSLELIEAKIHRLSKYYKRTGKLQQNWKYASVVAQLE